MDAFVIGIVACVIAAVVVFLHHRCLSASSGQALQCASQLRSCNVCSHEMWILVFLLVACGLAVFRGVIAILNMYGARRWILQ